MATVKLTFKKSEHKEQIRQTIENYLGYKLKFPNCNSTTHTDYFRFEVTQDQLVNLMPAIKNYLYLIMEIKQY